MISKCCHNYGFDIIMWRYIHVPCFYICTNRKLLENCRAIYKTMVESFHISKQRGMITPNTTTFSRRGVVVPHP